MCSFVLKTGNVKLRSVAFLCQSGGEEKKKVIMY